MAAMDRHFWRYLLLAGVLCLFSQASRADYWVQVGSYRLSLYADKEAQTLVAAGFSVITRQTSDAQGRTMLQLLVGPYPSRHEVAQALGSLTALGKGGLIRWYDRKATAQAQPPGTKGAAITPLPPQAPPAAQGKPALPKAPNPAAMPGAQRKTPVPAAPVIVAPSPPEKPVAPEDLFARSEEPHTSAPSITGFFQSELAYAEASPEHLSKFRHTLEVASQGRFTSDIAWKISGRVAYDAVFDLNDFYPTAVKDDQGLEGSLRETYLDISAGDWDFRLGRQHIIWGEMVGLFFADVVSAKDMREFVLPEFDLLRIPQWAVRGEYFKGDFHGEAIWVPYPTYDNIGVPGAEFYPYPVPPPPGYGMSFAGEHRPAGSLADSNYGLRASYLVEGWDLSGFYYSSMDASPAYIREIVAAPTPAFIYTPDHRRIQQLGGTLSKDFTTMLLKAEMVYSHDRLFTVNRLSDADGVVPKDVLDYVVGLEYSLPGSSRLNIQFFQEWFPNYDSAMSEKRVESGASLYLSTKLLDGKVEPQLLAIASLNREDWLVRPRVVWNVGADWRVAAGADLFGGSPLGLFGRFDNKDRLYTELRYTF